MSLICSVCLEPFGRGRGHPVEPCSDRCEHLCCSGCLRKHLTLQADELGTCPSCGEPLDVEYFACNLGDSYARTYFKRNNQKRWMSEQNALMASTQADHEVLLKCWRSEEDLKKMQDELRSLGVLVNQLSSSVQDHLGVIRCSKRDRDPKQGTDTRLNNLYGQLQMLQDLRVKSKMLLTSVEQWKHNDRSSTESQPSLGGTKTSQPCARESCRGFCSQESAEGGHLVLRCLLCDMFSCARCAKYLGSSDGLAEHVCRAEDVASAREIRNKSKPCPNLECQVPSVKTEGCDQVWCWNCHTTWSWRDGRVLNTTRVHAADFQRWRQSQPADKDLLAAQHDANVLLQAADRCCTDSPEGYQLQKALLLLHAWLEFGCSLRDLDDSEFMDQELQASLLRERLKYLSEHEHSNHNLQKRFERTVCSLQTASQVIKTNDVMLQELGQQVLQEISRFCSQDPTLFSSTRLLLQECHKTFERVRQRGRQTNSVIQQHMSRRYSPNRSVRYVRFDAVACVPLTKLMSKHKDATVMLQNCRPHLVTCSISTAGRLMLREERHTKKTQ